MLNKEINWKKEEESINKSLMYGKTIDELFDEMIDEMPWTKNAWDMLNVMTGYLGTEGAPTIDAGIFLMKFVEAVIDGRIEWKER